MPSSLLTTDKRKVQCRFTDVLYFYTTFRKYEVKGISNLQDFFYNRTLTWKNTAIDNVFIYSHLVALVDPMKFNVKPNNGTSESSI